MINQYKCFGKISSRLLALLVLVSVILTGCGTTAATDEELPIDLDDAASFDIEMGDIEVGDWVDWYVVAAETVGLEAETLLQEVENGKSVADIATEKGVELQTVTDAIMAAETNWLNEQVSNGDLSQEEVDEQLENLAEDVKQFLTEALE